MFQLSPTFCGSSLTKADASTTARFRFFIPRMPDASIAVNADSERPRNLGAKAAAAEMRMALRIAPLFSPRLLVTDHVPAGSQLSVSSPVLWCQRPEDCRELSERTHCCTPNGQQGF